MGLHSGLYFSVSGILQGREIRSQRKNSMQRRWRTSPCEQLRRIQPDGILVLDFQPPEVQQSRCLFFKPSLQHFLWQPKASKEADLFYTESRCWSLPGQVGVFRDRPLSLHCVSLSHVATQCTWLAQLSVLCSSLESRIIYLSFNVNNHLIDFWFLQ